MPKRREAKLVSSVIFVDGEPFLITQRERRGFVARRLKLKERELVFQLLANAHDEAFATLEPRALKTPFR